ncbi:MAG: hypothetical protein ABJA34_11990 [Pseudonocardiales bacterium]
MSKGYSPPGAPRGGTSKVQVIGAAEILATLDDRGRLDGLPFMPEMLRWCGQTVTVRARADKTCDTVEFAGLRRMNETVHLDDARCDGSEHGGCQAGCLLFWKEAWLRPVSDIPDVDPPPATALEALRTSSADGDRYYCQATELPRASEPLPWWAAGQYVRDVASGNVGIFGLARGLLVLFFNKYQGLSKRVLPRKLRIRGGRWYPFVIGTQTKTPIQTLDLQPGELVQVKTRREILDTLNAAGRNRGLSFDAEMLPYCGREFRVLRRVERIIDEKTGLMLQLPRDCIVLAGVTCQAFYHRFCPRAIYPYWREIWLKPVER